MGAGGRAHTDSDIESAIRRNTMEAEHVGPTAQSALDRPVHEVHVDYHGVVSELSGDKSPHAGPRSQREWSLLCVGEGDEWSRQLAARAKGQCGVFAIADADRLAGAASDCTHIFSQPLCLCCRHEDVAAEALQVLTDMARRGELCLLGVALVGSEAVRADRLARDASLSAGCHRPTPLRSLRAPATAGNTPSRLAPSLTGPPPRTPLTPHTRSPASPLGSACAVGGRAAGDDGAPRGEHPRHAPHQPLQGLAEGPR